MNAVVTNAPDIAIKQVDSSLLYGHGHDPKTNTLAVQFPRKGENGEKIPGALYHYANFTAAQYDDFDKAESAGKHFGKFIKPMTDAHPFTRIN